VLAERVKSGLSSAAANSAGAAQSAADKAAALAREAAQLATGKAAALARDAASGASSAVVGGAARSVDAVKAATREAASAASSAALTATQRSADAVRQGAGRAAGAVTAGVRDGATRTAEAARSVGTDAGRAVGERVAALDPRTRLAAWLKWARNWLLGGLFLALSAYAFGSAAPYALKDLLLEIDRRRREESRLAAASPPALAAAPALGDGSLAPVRSRTPAQQDGPGKNDDSDVLPDVPKGWEWGPPIGSLQAAGPTKASSSSLAQAEPSEQMPGVSSLSWLWPASETRR
jgi:hypothetical protein